MCAPFLRTGSPKRGSRDGPGPEARHLGEITMRPPGTSAAQKRGDIPLSLTDHRPSQEASFLEDPLFEKSPTQVDIERMLATCSGGISGGFLFNIFLCPSEHREI